MLRDERQVALNDVIVACKGAADDYEAAAAMIDDPALSRLLADCAAQRHRLAAALDAQIRRLGDLPRGPDADAGTIERAFTRLKAALSGDERATLLREREEAEAKIGRCVAVALEKDLPEETRMVLRRLAEDSARAARRLAAAREA